MLTVSSKLLWLLVRFGWHLGIYDPMWQWLIRLLVRLLQFGLCLTSLILLCTGFAIGSFNGRSTMLGSSYVLVAELLAFLAMIYSLWCVCCIEFVHLSPRPRAFYSATMDLVVAMCLLVAGIVLLLSNFVRDCLSFGQFVRCSNLNAAVVFLFLSTGSFLLTPWLMNHWGKREQAQPVEQAPATPSQPYQEVATPTTQGDAAVQLA